MRVEEKDDEEDEGACETSALLVTTNAEEGPSRHSQAVARREEALVAREGAAAARDFSALHSPPHEVRSSGLTSDQPEAAAIPGPCFFM